MAETLEPHQRDALACAIRYLRTGGPAPSRMQVEWAWEGVRALHDFDLSRLRASQSVAPPAGTERATPAPAAEPTREETTQQVHEGWTKKDQPQEPEPSRDASGLRKFAAFGAKVLAAFREDLGNLDGGDVQAWALQAGVLEEREVHAPCSAVCACAEWSCRFPTTCLFLPDDVLAVSGVPTSVVLAVDPSWSTPDAVVSPASTPTPKG